MTEALQEYADSRGLDLRVDRTGGVLRGVKLIGLESQNGRRYRPEALSAAIGLYEGAKVNVNHPKDGPLAPRDYRDRLGIIRQVEFRPGEGLFGNLHFNSKHALAEQLAWDAEHNPRNVGFSHNVLARLSRDGAATVVEAITHVQSVDLVADPAATHGLFEQSASYGAGGDETPSAIDAATVEELTKRRPDLIEQLIAERQREWQIELGAVEAREQQLARRLRILELLDAHAVERGPGVSAAAAVGQAFYEALLKAGDDAQLESLVAERAAALRRVSEASASSARPRSSEPLAALARRAAKPVDAREFARAICARS